MLAVVGHVMKRQRVATEQGSAQDCVLQLHNIVRMNLQVLLRPDGSPAFASSAVGSILRPRWIAPSLTNSPVEDDIDIAVVLKPVDEMAVEPRMSSRDDKEVAHRDVIVLHGAQNHLNDVRRRRPPSQLLQRRSRSRCGSSADTDGLGATVAGADTTLGQAC